MTTDLFTLEIVKDALVAVGYEMFDAMIPVYQRHFTKGDIDAFVTFYSTAAGQKMLKELPAITAESMQASMGIAQKMMADMQQQIQADIARMQKENVSPPDSNGVR